eukprot:gene40944-50661_t
MLDGLRHGQGWNIRHDREAYQGDYLHGEMCGYGVYTYSNGDRYEGFWLDSIASGQGVYWTAKNCTVYAATTKGYGISVSNVVKTPN